MSYTRIPGPAWRRINGHKVIRPSEDYMKAMTVDCPYCFAPPTTPCQGMENEPNNFHLVRLEAWKKRWEAVN